MMYVPLTLSFSNSIAVYVFFSPVLSFLPLSHCYSSYLSLSRITFCT